MSRDSGNDSNIACEAIRMQDRLGRFIRAGFLGHATLSVVKRPQGLICGGETYG
jgi:hypothetical protein